MKSTFQRYTSSDVLIVFYNNDWRTIIYSKTLSAICFAPSEKPHISEDVRKELEFRRHLYTTIIPPLIIKLHNLRTDLVT